MTEAQWLASADVAPMLDCVTSGSHRKQRLVCLACCERFRDLLQHKDALHALATAERWIEGKCQEGQRKAARRGVTYASAAASEASLEAGLLLSDSATFAVQRLLQGGGVEIANILYALAEARQKDAGARAALAKTDPAIADFERTAAFESEKAAQAQIVRDIFGNPFRLVAFNPAWSTDTAITLARQIYESRDFGAMPILADALQDAGCEDEQVLTHCRAAGPHARGCWVVDGVLGKA